MRNAAGNRFRQALTSAMGGALSPQGSIDDRSSYGVEDSYSPIGKGEDLERNDDALPCERGNG